MAKILVCDGALYPAEVGRNSVPDVLACDGGWQIIDYVEPDLTALRELFESVFSTPSEIQIQAAFSVGFVLPLIAYLTSWAYQVVINFVNGR